MDQALAMLTGQRREKNRQKKSMYLSAARSYIFNQVLMARIDQGLWGKSLIGDVDVASNETYDANKVTAPMWGRGRLSSLADALALEQGIAQPLQDLCNGMEHAGLNQERREVVSAIENLQWHWSEEEGGDVLIISFDLASGHYATSVLQEIMQVIEPERDENNRFVYNSTEKQSKAGGE
jgi:tRNA pseudouridine13 synthase